MKEYITRKGQTWDEIAYEVYGDEFKVDILMEANPTLLDTFVFGHDIVLSVPELSDVRSGADKPPWRD